MAELCKTCHMRGTHKFDCPEQGTNKSTHPENGYYVIDSVRAMRHDWKEHVVAWFARLEYARRVVTTLRELDCNDYIILDEKGRVV